MKYLESEKKKSIEIRKLAKERKKMRDLTVFLAFFYFPVAGTSKIQMVANCYMFTSIGLSI